MGEHGSFSPPVKFFITSRSDVSPLCPIATKQGAIVGGQTSCKAPEIAAFEAHLPSDVSIISCHSLHGPNVNPRGQPLVVIPYRAAPEKLELISRILDCFGSKQVRLTAERHDAITADTQAVTHAAFLSMGTAWRANSQFPWELGRYVGGIENVKINITLRIYSNRWHVYAGLAILNPSAKNQIRQYAESVTELFKLMLEGDRKGLWERVLKAKAAVFGEVNGAGRDLLLKRELLDHFSIGDKSKPVEKTPNNHLSLLAMVDCWWKLGIVPYDHMICSTPVCPSANFCFSLDNGQPCGWQELPSCPRTPSSLFFRSSTRALALGLWLHNLPVKARAQPHSPLVLHRGWC